MRLIAGEYLADVLGFQNSGESFGRNGGALIIEDVAAHPRPMHASNLCVTRISDDRSRQCDFGVRERDRISQRSKIRNWVVSRIKTVSRNLAKIGNRSLSPRINLPLGDPQRRIITAGIERVDTCPFLCAADEAVEFSAGKIV